MKTDKYINALKNPNVLEKELDLLLDEKNKIEGDKCNFKGEEEKNKLKGEIINNIDGITDLVIKNEIYSESLLEKIKSFLNERIEVKGNREYYNSTYNLEWQLEKIENIKPIKIIESTKYKFSVDDNSRDPSEVLVPDVDDVELKKFKRFQHENTSLFNVELGEKSMEAQNTLQYKDEMDYRYMNLNNNSIFPKNTYSEDKEMCSKMPVGKKMYGENNGIFIDFLNEGNICIETENLKENSTIIDDFIVSYIFKTLEFFPLGRVQFSILDSEDRWAFKKFSLNMHSYNASIIAKNTVKLYTDKSQFLADAVTNKCGQIANKMTDGINNIYDLCEYDKDECMNFVIIRDPLSNFDDTELKKLMSMVRVNDTSHVCGFRFLTIIEGNKINDQNIESYNEILNNSEIQFKVEDKSFKIGETLIKQLEIPKDKNNSDTISFINNYSSMLMSKLNSLSSRALSFESVYPKDEKPCHFDSSIIEIPIGKSGNKIFELPFSSANENQTAAGDVVNYMVVGATGSGKSSLMHSVVINGARKYSPNDLKFWILDFKDGQESERYKEANIPHIDILSSRNTQDDALYVFKMILEETQRRKAIFSSEGCEKIHQYNIKMDEAGKDHIPHIIVVIDEAQELFKNEDSDSGYSEKASRLNELVRETSTKIRSYGIHLLLIAQNLNSCYGLETSYLPQARGRIAFSLTEDALSNSSLGSTFNNNRKDIASLPVGNAYIAIKDELHKIRLAFDKSFDLYFDEIKEKYKKYTHIYKTRIIGEDSKLSSFNVTPYLNKNYHQIITQIPNSLDGQTAVIGENSYSLEPMSLKFTPNENSNLLIMGSTNNMATSIMKSIIKSIKKSYNDIYVINGDKTNYEDPLSREKRGNPLTEFCKKTKVNIKTVNETSSLFEEIYKEMMSRKKQTDESIDEISFKPIYIFLNDLNKFDQLINNIELYPKDSYSNDETVESNCVPTDEEFLNRILEEAKKSDSSDNEIESIFIKDAFEKIIQIGNNYSIYIICSLIFSVSDSFSDYISNLFSKLIIYNKMIKDSIPNSSINRNTIFDMLISIKNEYFEETRALFVDNNTVIKIRPVLYDMNKKELQLEEDK